MERQQVWHHGLVARYWAEFETEGGPEAAHFHTIIRSHVSNAIDTCAKEPYPWI